MRMPSKKNYNLVVNDEYDSRIPLHPEEAFQHGITFSAKYIGSLDVPRPTSRVEIVAAMRRIRYEFKAKAIKKRKVTVEISVRGIKISIRKKSRGGGSSGCRDESELQMMQHPIYRVFYVSHDSQDLKIFSYIARDAASNVFKCNVFKANKKNQAMRVVRTVGQAFEVCHKFSSATASPSTNDPNEDDSASDEGSEQTISKSDADKNDIIDRDATEVDEEEEDEDEGEEDNEEEMLMTLSRSDEDDLSSHANRPHNLAPLPPPPGALLSKGEIYTSPLGDPLSGDTTHLPAAGTPLTCHHELQLLHEQLEQQQQQTQAAVAQARLLRDQLAAETTARLEAQARTHQLLVHNKDLLEHIQKLVLQVRDLELSIQASGQLVQNVPYPPDLTLQQNVGLSPLGRLAEAHIGSYTPPSPSPSCTLQSFNFPSVAGVCSAAALGGAQLTSSSSALNGSVLSPTIPETPQMARDASPRGPQCSPTHSSLIAPLPESSESVSKMSDLLTSVNQSDSNVTTALAHLPQRGSIQQLQQQRQKQHQQLHPVGGDENRRIVPLSPLAVLHPEQPLITRTASERLARQQTLAQLQRAAWARHTTK